MRLTLRTLLAYLDDVLPPDQAKELGKKLTESNYATALVDRIKEVMRRRRLTAPELFGPAAGIEPNVVAEYLDNELTPNDIADVERICLESDMHLAEVAACHQILTLVLGEPVDVRAETRARMYALGPVGREDTLSSEDAGLKPARAPEQPMMPPIAAALTASQEFRVSHEVPDYLRDRSPWRRLSLLVMVLFIVAWVGLLMRDPTVFTGLNPAERPDGLAANGAGNNARDQDAPGTRVAQATTNLANNNPAPTTTVESPVTTRNVTDKRAAPNSEVPMVEERPLAIAKNDPANPDGTLPLNAPIENVPRVKPSAPLPVEPPKPAPATEPVPAPPAPVEEPALPPSKLVDISKEGVLLYWNEAVSDFMVLPRRSELKPGDRLACPDPFRTDITVNQDTCQMALIGGTALRCLGPTAKTSFGLDISQGAVLFEIKGPPPADDAAAPVADPALANKSKLSVALVLRGVSHRLELVSDDAFCGIEVHRREPSHFETEPDAPGYSAALHVARGTVRLTVEDGEAKSIDAPGFLPLTPDMAPSLKTSDLGRPSQLILPDWLEADPKRAATKIKRPYNTPFEREFDAEQPLLLSMPAVVSNPRPTISELAVKCLTLTDSFQPLVKALVTSSHREARLAAISGLRQWLPQDARHRAVLKSELARQFLPSDADAVYRLLWGFNADDVRHPAASRQLVGWLDHEQVAIRELAFFHVQRLTGFKLDYSPINPPAQRRAAVDRWYAHLEKRGGALVQD